MEHQNHQRIISRYSLTGQLLETYRNAKVAAAAMDSHPTYIAMAARTNNRVHTACGYIWRRGTQSEIDVRPLLKTVGQGNSPLLAKIKTIGQYDLEGNLVATHGNTKEAAKAVGVHYKGVRDVINGKGMTYGGFIWSKNIKKKIAVNPRITERIAGVSQYDLDGRWIRSFKNCYEASRISGLDNGHIDQALKGIVVTAGGYIWCKGQHLRLNVNELRRHPAYKGSKLECHMKRKRTMAV